MASMNIQYFLIKNIGWIIYVIHVVHYWIWQDKKHLDFQHIITFHYIITFQKWILAYSCSYT